MKKTKVAICYDFDGTFFPGTMLDYDFARKINMDISAFFEKSAQLMNNTDADFVLAYMCLMLKEFATKNIPLTYQELLNYGKNLPLFPGVKTWFDRINKYGKENGLIVEHYIISSGLKEVILGCPISKKIKYIYASSFMYDENGNAVWPATALNYTAKTQCIFRINKGCLGINDQRVNDFIPDNKRAIPLPRIIYIGDGITDIPCMSLIKKGNGHSIAVYCSQNEKSQNVAYRLFKDNRANFIAEADYSQNSMMEKIVKSILDKIKSDLRMEELKKQSRSVK